MGKAEQTVVSRHGIGRTRAFVAVVARAIGLLGVALTLTACAGGQASPNVNALNVPHASRAFTSQGELRAAIRTADQARHAVCLSVTPAAEERPAKRSLRGKRSQRRRVRLAETVAGVRDPQVIATDGSHIYTVSERSLFVVDARDALSTAVVGSILLPGTAQGLLVHGKRALVYGTFVDRERLFADQGVQQITYAAVYDVQAKTKPRLIVRHIFEGRVVDVGSRNGVAHLTVTSAAVARLEPSPLLGRDQLVRHVPIANTSSYQEPSRRPSFVTVHGLKLSHPRQIDSRAILVSKLAAVYAARGQLFIAEVTKLSTSVLARSLYPKLLGARLTANDKAVIARIGAVAGDVLSPTEKALKIARVYCDRLAGIPADERNEVQRRAKLGLVEAIQKAGSPFSTAVHRFTLRGRAIDVGPSAVVSGQLLNRLSIDAHRGVLRLATMLTEDPAVYILDDTMKVIGALVGLGQEEGVFAARFVGDRLYLLSAFDDQPMPTIDLSTPAKPTKLGELRMPGFAHYLHPYGDAHAVGIGAIEANRRGVKITVFGLRGGASPGVTAQLSVDDLATPVTPAAGHPAIVIDAAKRLVLVPVTSADTPGFGTLVVTGGIDSLRQLGVIWHDKPLLPGVGPQAIQGAVLIGSRLYTKSSAILRATSLAGFKELATVFLR